MDTKQTINERKLPGESASEYLERMGYSPIAHLAKIASGDMECCICRGAGRTKYQRSSNGRKVLTCENCGGSGKEQVSPQLRAQVLLALAKARGSRVGQGGARRVTMASLMNELLSN